MVVPVAFLVIPVWKTCQDPAALPAPSRAVIWKPCLAVVEPVKATVTDCAELGTYESGAVMANDAVPEFSAKPPWQLTQVLSPGAPV